MVGVFYRQKKPAIQMIVTPSEIAGVVSNIANNILDGVNYNKGLADKNPFFGRLSRKKTACLRRMLETQAAVSSVLLLIKVRHGYQYL